jgi:hypothetical protein
LAIVAARFLWDECDEITGMAEVRPLVGVIMGSQSDWETMRQAACRRGGSGRVS